jgi:hypothetical protein
VFVAKFVDLFDYIGQKLGKLECFKQVYFCPILLKVLDNKRVGVYKFTHLYVGKWRSWLAQQTVNLLVESSSLSFPAILFISLFHPHLNPRNFTQPGMSLSISC